MASGTIRGITIEIEGKTSGLVKSLDAVNKDLRTTQSNLKTLNQALKLDPSNFDALKQKQGQLNTAIEQTKQKLELEKQAAIDAAKALEEGTITQGQYDALQAEIAKTTAELNNLEAEASKVASALDDSFSAKASKAFTDMGASLENAGEKLKTFGKDVEEVGGKLTKTVTTGVVALGTASVASAVDFETAMAKVSTIADTTSVSMDDMQSAILDLSNETGIAATDIADAVYNAISAGQDTADAVSFVSNATRLSKAGFAETADTLDILTTIMNAYGMSADKVGKVSDVLIQTQNLGKTTVAELSSSMGKIIPTANAANVSLENVAAGYATLTANGIATAEATTYMNGMLNELSKSGTKVSDTLKDKTGSSFAELMDSGKSLSDVLEIISEAAAENELSLTDMFGSAEAGRAALVLLGDDASNFNATLGEMKKAAGSTQEAFDKMDATNASQAQKTLNELKNTAIELGDTILSMLAPVIEEVSGKIHELSQWFSKLDDSQKKTIVIIGGVVAAIGPLLIVIGKISTGIGAIVSVCGTISSFIGGTLIPLVADTVVPYITGTLIPTIASIATPILAVIAVITAIIVVIKNWDAIVEVFQYAWETFTNFVSESSAKLKENVTEAWNKMKDTLSNKVEEIKTKISDTWENIKTSVSNKVKEIETNISNTWENMKTSVTNKVVEIKDNIVNGFQSAIDWITGLPEQALQWGKDLIQGLIDGINSKITDVTNAVQNVANKITSFLHFSRPDEGPLREYEKWMPDMMKGLAQGITSNIGVLDTALNQVSATMAQSIEQKDYTPAFAGLQSSIEGMSSEVVIPVTIGGERLETLVVKAINNMNYKSGGR